MSNETTVAQIGDLFPPSVMAAEYDYLLSDTADFFGHPALIYAGSAPGSNVVKFSFSSLGGSTALADGTEGTAAATTAWTDASTSVTVAWKTKNYRVTDLAQEIASGKLSPAEFAKDAAISTSQKLVDMIAALSSGFSQSVGTTTVGLTNQKFIDAQTLLDVNSVTGQLLCILHPKQFGQLKTDALSLGGAVQHRADAQAIFSQNGQYKGQLYGVDIFTSTLVDTANAGADRLGMMFGRRAVVWADKVIPPSIAGIGVSLGRARLGIQRDEAAGLDVIVTHAYLGCSEGIDAAGVGILSSAT